MYHASMLPALLALAPPIYAPPRPYTLESVKTRTRNADLPLQLEGDPARVLPQSETLSLALDTHLFFRKARDFAGYYHGGYWIAPLVELRPREDVAVNTR